MTGLRFSPPAVLLAGLLLAAMSGPAAAQGIPVNDSIAILRLIDQYVRQGLMYDRQGLELDEAIRQTASITGARALGTLHQTPELIQMRRRLPVLLFDLNRLSELIPDLEPDSPQSLQRIFGLGLIALTMQITNKARAQDQAELVAELGDLAKSMVEAEGWSSL